MSVVRLVQPVARASSCLGSQLWRWTHPVLVLPALPGAATNTGRGKVSPCLWADTEKDGEEGAELL